MSSPERPDEQDVPAVTAEPLPRPSPGMAYDGVQDVSLTHPASGEAVAVALEVLLGEMTIADSIGRVATYFGSHDRVDTVVAALTTLAPEDSTGWVHLGLRAWLREWLSPGSVVRVVPDSDAGPEAALTMPWMSQRARDDVVVIPDAEGLPPEAAQDRAEFASCNAAALMGAAQMSDGTMYGSLSVASARPGLWPEELVADLRLLSAALTSRMASEHAKRSLADAIALGDQARAAQQQFFATIGHELRTPIAAITGFAEVLGDEAGDRTRNGSVDRAFAATVARDSGVILRAAEQLHAIVEDLLSTGRTLGNEEARADHDVAAAVEDVIHWHRTPARAGGIAVVSTVEPGLSVHVRASGLRQVLTNLVGNAIIYNKPGGTVEISTEQSWGESREPRLRLMVRDTGKGLDPEQLRTVFDPFVRFADQQVKGTGLGLSLARAVAERDGGVVGAESTPGEGSVFWVDLPVTPL